MACTYHSTLGPLTAKPCSPMSSLEHTLIWVAVEGEAMISLR